ncbi:MAG TPA: hypothetical protein VGN72_05120 [Tepidisphaeraceae bacterium]|jgi:hypothetical protein|nr:hypothetical protein [Tepidisphaeraceae bacterium]
MRLAGIVTVLGVLIGCQPSHRTKAADPLQPEGQRAATTRPASAHDEAITLDLDVSLDARQSVVWCATAQIAWAELGQRFGGAASLDPIHSNALRDAADDATSLAMNQFPREWVDQRKIVAEAGEFTQPWLSEVRAMVREKFGDDFETPLLDQLEASETPTDIATYSALHVLAPFKHVFPTRETTFGVGGDPNHASNGGMETSPIYHGFGIRRTSSPEGPELALAAAQVIIHWYTPPKRLLEVIGMSEGEPMEDAAADEVGYLVELKSTTSREHLLLARLGEPKSLRAAIANAMRRFRNPNTRSVNQANVLEQISREGRSIEESIALMQNLDLADRLGPFDEFLAPLLTIDAVRQYPSLLGRDFRSPEALRRYRLAMAGQSIRFSLNEKGASLESEAALGGLFGGGTRIFDFSNPFLVMLVHDDAPWPYFAAWVGDDTFLMLAPPEKQPDATEDPDL